MISNKIRRYTVATAILAAGALLSVSAHAVKVGPVEDPIGVLKLEPGEPLQLGGMFVVSGPDSAYGVDGSRAVDIAIEDEGGSLLGHPIRHLIEDNTCNAEGGQTAATKFAANQKIVAVVGIDCSSAATPAAPILWQAGISSVGSTPTAPALTDPNRDSSYDGFLRVIYNDLAQGRGDALWFYNELGCRTAAGIHDGSPYAEQLVRVAVSNFEELGGKVTAIEAIAPTDVDMRPVLTRMAADKPCVIYYPVFLAAGAHITRQAREIDGLENSRLVGSANMLAPPFVEAAGSAVIGVGVTMTDVSVEAMGIVYPKYLERHMEKFGEDPVQGFHMYSYDAAKVVFRAIEKVAVKDDAGNTYIGRKALRDALFATKNYEGMSGTLTCNPHGDCGEFKFAAFVFTSPDPATFKLGVNPKKVYPVQ